MKNLIFILIVTLITGVNLYSTGYKFFTAKQGLPKAIETSKQISSDSLHLLAVYCSYIYIDQSLYARPVEITTVNDTTGTAQQWYYDFAFNKIDSLYRIKIKNDGNNFIIDSLIIFADSLSKHDIPININEFNIDSDSLNGCSLKCARFFEFVPLNMMILRYDKVYSPLQHSYLIWESEYFDFNTNDTGGQYLYIDALTGECYEITLDIKDNNYDEQIFKIKIISNSDIITIHSNQELAQNTVLRLYNQLGSLIKETKFESQDYQISTASLSTGIYFVQLISGNKIETKPVMVLH